MNIRVTRNDITKGVRCAPQSCPVALAVSREFPRAYVSVRLTTVEVEHTITELPRSAQRFINAFDGQRKVRPFSFRIRRPL